MPERELQRSRRTGLFTFVGDDFEFEVELRYVSSARFGQLEKEATKQRLVDGRWADERDDRKYYELCAEEMIVNWTGFLGRHAQQIADWETYPDDHATIPCTNHYRYELLRFSEVFDQWATNNCKKFARFVALEQAKRKNGSSPTPASSSSHADEAAAAHSLAENA